MKKTLLIVFLTLLSFNFYALSPAVTIIQPNGNQFIKGSINIQFAWAEGSGQPISRLDANIYYSSNPLGFQNLVVQDLNLLSQQNCSDNDNSQITVQNCIYLWNTSNISDGNYYLDIRVVSNDGNIAMDSSDASFTIDNTAPEKPFGFSGDSNTENKVFLDWEQPFESGSGIEHYNVYRHTQDINTSNKENHKIGETKNTSFVDNSVQANTFYKYRVSAVDRAGNESELSTQIGVQTKSFENTSGFDQNGKIQILPEFNEIFLEKNIVTTTIFSVKNLTFEKQCLNFSVFKESSRINARIETKQACLNTGEKTFIGMKLDTTSTPRGDYLLEFRAHNNKISGHATILARVGTAKKIRLQPFTATVCKGSRTILRVLIENNTSAIQKIRLEASSLDLLPRFIEPSIILNEGEERFLDLEVAVPKSSETGLEKFNIFAFTEDDYTEEEASINITECAFEEELNFSLTLPSSCQETAKNSFLEIPLQVKNLSDKEQTVNLEAISILDVNIQKNVLLTSNETKNLLLQVKPRLTDFAGNHNIELIAWNKDNTIKRNACVSVQGIKLSSVELEKNNIEIEKGKHGVFTLIIDNIGDLSQTYTVKVSGNKKETVQLSETRFTLSPRERRKVFVSVTPLLESTATTNFFDVIIEAEKIFRERLEYTVKEQPIEITEKEPEIAGYPKKIITQNNTTKLFNVTIANLSSKFVNAQLSFKLPEKTVMDKRFFTLEPNETKTISNLLKIGDLNEGEFTGKIILILDNKQKSVEFTIKNSSMKKNVNKESQGFFTGFLSATENIFLGAIIIILVFLLIGFLTGIKTKNTKPVWLRR